ncbi:hypothetical protein DPSP01_005720 [Paraphaeosphaeria sporulosa]
MASDGAWEALNDGVMVFVPTGNRESNIQDSSPADGMMSRKSIDDDLNGHISGQTRDAVRPPLAEIPHNTVPHDRADSPSTIQGDYLRVILTPMSSVSISDPEWYTQLQRYASGEGHYPQDIAATMQSCTQTSGYDTDRTDPLLDDTETPCPRRTIATVHPTSASSNTSSRRLQHRIAIRQPTFRSTSVSRRRARRESRRAPEYPVRHPKWTNEQRYNLAIIFRFFEADTDKLCQVFNTMHGLNLDTKKQIKPQERHLRDNIEAYPFCFAIYNCPIQDPADTFASDRAAVEEVAKQLGIKLQRRQKEAHPILGSAKTARSEITRNRFDRLVLKKPSDADNASLVCNLQPQVRMKQIRLGGIALQIAGVDEVEVELGADEAYASDLEEDPIPLSPRTPRHRPLQPAHSVAYRVWDSHS